MIRTCSHPHVITIRATDRMGRCEHCKATFRVRPLTVNGKLVVGMPAAIAVAPQNKDT